MKRHFSNFIAINQLKPGTTYYIEVVAVTDDNLESARSETMSQMTGKTCREMYLCSSQYLALYTQSSNLHLLLIFLSV